MGRVRKTIAWAAIVLLDIAELATTDPFLRAMEKYYYGHSLPSRIAREKSYLRARRRLLELDQIIKTRDGFDLTPEGKLQLNVFAVSARIPGGDWDGKWKVFMFDVPERLREQRNKLRQQLRRLGFHQLHRSVWVSPFHPPNELWTVLRRSHLLHYSRYLTAESIDYDADLRHRFHLPK